MKGLMVFFTLALVASASAGTQRFDDKGVIEDALAMKACLEKALATIQGSVNDLLNTVNKIQTLINSNVDKFKHCQTLGVIAQAACMASLSNSIQADVNKLIDDINQNVNNLLGAAGAISACIPSKVAERGILEDALAMKQCLEKALATIQGSVNDLLSTVNKIQTLITSNVDKLKNCQTLGVIQQAACIMNLVDSIQADVNTLVSSITESVNNLLGAADTVTACFSPSQNKGIIDDALAMKECLEKALATIQGSVNDLLSTVSKIQDLITTNVDKLNHCQTLGPIQQAVCIKNLMDSAQADINNLVSSVTESVNNLIGAADTVTACLAPSQDKGVIEDVLALKECLEKAIITLEESVADLINVINTMEDVINTSVEKLKVCQAITSITQQAACIVGLAGEIQQDINQLVGQVQESVNILLGAGETITACLKPQVAGKASLGEILALLQCVEDVMFAFEDEIEHMFLTVMEIQAMLYNYESKFRECTALAGPNATVAEQIQSAACIMGLTDPLQNDIATQLKKITAHLSELVTIANDLEVCYNTKKF